MEDILLISSVIVCVSIIYDSVFGINSPDNRLIKINKKITELVSKIDDLEGKLDRKE